eukprot:g4250.t1
MASLASTASALVGLASALAALAQELLGIASDPSAWVWATALGLAWLLVRAYVLDDTPRVRVALEPEEREDVLRGRAKFDPATMPAAAARGKVPCWDPCTMDALGELEADSAERVREKVALARAAQAQWASSSFAQRRRLMRTLRRYIVENMDTIARVAVRDSGKTMVDAYFGEVLVTCEKLKWLASGAGEAALRDERRAPGSMMMTKRVRVEYRPFGVIGAIVPWNYPFHNVFNPLSAALFAGNGIVIKVSEYASWSAQYYGRVIDACLRAAGAPAGLVQFVFGHAEAGSALVTSGADKLIFVGSPGVGAKVMAAAAPALTPVVLELGGKDPFVVCDDADLGAVLQIAVRGVFQNMGQNCAGPERFFVHAAVHDDFAARAAALVSTLRTGASLGDAYVDCGAITMGRRQMEHYQALVDDAVRRGARLLAGGRLPSASAAASGSFYPPTVLAGVPHDARIASEEIFGPIMCIFSVPADGFDAGVVRAANKGCEFALSSCAFSASRARAAKIAGGLRAGMSAVNDLEGTTYMSQSLPFGGCGKSGFDRFAGPEGLRGLCVVRAVSEDRVAWLRTSIPPPLQYPSTGRGAAFSAALIRLFYGHGPWQKLLGVVDILKAVAGPAPPRAAAKKEE